MLAVLLLFVGCGIVGTDDEITAGDAERSRLRIPKEVDEDEGCGEASRTEPADLASDRTVARCASGFPEPQALAQPATLRIGIRGRSEDLAPLLLADHFEEFAAEGLTVEFVEYDTAPGLFGAVERGEVDVAAGQLDAAFFDNVEQGGTARAVLGGAVASAPHETDVAQAGFWMRTDILDDTNYWDEMEEYENAVAVEDLIGDAVSYPTDFVLQQHDMSLNNLNLTMDGGESAVDRMLDGELLAAWVDDPYWRPLADRDNWKENWTFALVATLPASESLDGVVFNGRMLDPARDRGVGLAFNRALIRTINTYLSGDYQDDEDVVAALAEETRLDEDDIVKTPAWVFDWELREGTTERIQDALLTLSGVLYESELAEDQLLDRSLYADAVGT